MNVNREKMFVFMLLVSIMMLAFIIRGSAAVASADQKPSNGLGNVKSPSHVLQGQQQASPLNVAMIISAWQYYSQSIITTINQSLELLVANNTDLNVSMIVVEGQTPRQVLENLLNVTINIVQDDAFDDVILFVAPWEDVQVRYELGKLHQQGTLKPNIVFFDSLRPDNNRDYLHYYGFADEEMAFVAGAISSYVSDKMTVEVDEIVLYTTLPDIGPSNPKQDNIAEWHDFTTDVSVTGFIQGVLYQDQRFDVTTTQLFTDLDQIMDASYVARVYENIAKQMTDGGLPVVAMRVPYNMTSAVASTLNASSNDSILVVLDHDIPLSPAVPYSLSKNHTFLLEKVLNDIKSNNLAINQRYSLIDGSYDVRYFGGSIPADLKAIITEIAENYENGTLNIPAVIATATIQPLDLSTIVVGILSVTFMFWKKKRRTQGA